MVHITALCVQTIQIALHARPIFQILIFTINFVISNNSGQCFFLVCGSAHYNCTCLIQMCGWSVFIVVFKNVKIVTKILICLFCACYQILFSYQVPFIGVLQLVRFVSSAGRKRRWWTIQIFDTYSIVTIFIET